MPKQDQLSTAVIAFEHWRSNKNGSQLKQWRHTLEHAEKAPLFVHLPISPPLTQPPLTVELRFAQGSEMSLSGGIDSHLILSLIGAMKS